MSPFLRDLALTAATSVATVIASLFVTRLLAGGLGPTDFGAYTIVRLVVTTVVPISTLSTGVALARYLGLESGRGGSAAGYLSSAFGLTMVSTGAIVLVLLVARTTLATWLFGSSAYGTLIAAAAFMVGGASLFEIAYSDYRGRLQMARANLSQLLVVAIGPLVVALLWAGSASTGQIVFLMGALAYPIALVLGRRVAMDAAAARQVQARSRPRKELLRYGLPRVPGALALAGLMMLGPSLAANFFGLANAGYLAVGQYMVRIAEAAVVAFGVVAMPRVAQQLGSGDEESIRTAVTDLVALLFQVGLYVTLHLWLWADVLIPLWLGPEYVVSIPITRIVVLSLAPYLAYSLLHAIVNALEVRAVNTRTAIVALATATVVSLGLKYAGAGLLGVAAGSAIGFALLGLLTLAYLQRRLRLGWRQLMLIRVVLANVPLCIVAWAAHRWLIPPDRGLASLVCLGAVEAVIFLAYLALLRRWKAGWIEQLTKRILVRRSDA
jgi:O-antigen/teichoic acid export membrane protein